MNIKPICAVAMAATMLAFTGCSNEGTRGNGKEGEVVVRISTPRQSENNTRAEGHHVSNDQLTLGEGFLFFTNAAIVSKIVPIRTTAAPGAVTIADLQAGTTISGVSTNVDGCYIVANLPAAVSTSINNSISLGTNLLTALGGTNINVQDIAAGTDGVSKVPQFGVGQVSGSGNKTVTIELEAMSSRLQIEKISGDATIKSFKVDGIFVNNYFKGMSVDYKAGQDLTNNGADANHYGGTSNVYTAGVGLALADYNDGFSTPVVSSSLVSNVATAIPAGTDQSGVKYVWGYNVWPTEHMQPAGSVATIPHIVIRLKDIVVNNNGTAQNLPGVKYITVKGLKNAANSTQIEKIDNGWAYTLSDINFSASNLTLNPEEQTVSATVTVTLLNWKELAVTPEM